MRLTPEVFADLYLWGVFLVMLSLVLFPPQRNRD